VEIILKQAHEEVLLESPLEKRTSMWKPEWAELEMDYCVALI
jgi:hypothetical protein